MNPSTIPSQAYLREALSYDRKTGILTWRVRPVGHFTGLGASRSPEWLCNNWNSKFAGKEAGAIRVTHPEWPYRYTRVAGTRFPTHTIIMMMEIGVYVPRTDHRDGNGLNNRWDNIRPATNSQNMMNRRHGKRKEPHIPKGVARNGLGYMANIQLDKVRHYLGTFKTPEEAHNAYCQAANKLFGEFANDGHL